MKAKSSNDLILLTCTACVYAGYDILLLRATKLQKSLTFAVADVSGHYHENTL